MDHISLSRGALRGETLKKSSSVGEGDLLVPRSFFLVFLWGSGPGEMRRTFVREILMPVGFCCCCWWGAPRELLLRRRGRAGPHTTRHSKGA
jgi:hypothetical protein